MLIRLLRTTNSAERITLAIYLVVSVSSSLAFLARVASTFPIAFPKLIMWRPSMFNVRATR